MERIPVENPAPVGYDFALLYDVQRTSRDIARFHVFPRYVPRQGEFSFIISCCNVIHDCFGAVTYAAQKAGDAFGRIIGFTPDFIKDRIYPVNPINGRRHLMLIPRFIEKVISDWWLTPSMMYYESPSYARISVGSAQECVSTVFRKIVGKNAPLLQPDLFGDVNRFHYRATVVREDEINAYAIPGGQVCLCDKLVTEIDNALQNRDILSVTVRLPEGSTVLVDVDDVTIEDVLAALLAHEITHIASRHSLAGDILESVFKWLAVPVKLFSKKLAHGLRDMCELFVSREMEYEADITGIYMAHKAGFNPLGALYLEEFFRRELTFFQQLRNEYLEISTHPSVKNRIAVAFAAIERLDPERLRGAHWRKVDHGQDPAHASLSTATVEAIYAGMRPPARPLEEE